jgi:hypothetical protein
LRGLFAQSLVDSALVAGRAVWVIDGTNWPRPAAPASADRTREDRPLPGGPKRCRAGLVVPVVGGGAGTGWQLGVASGGAATRTDGQVGDPARAGPDHRGPSCPDDRGATPGGAQQRRRRSLGPSGQTPRGVSRSRSARWSRPAAFTR